MLATLLHMFQDNEFIQCPFLYSVSYIQTKSVWSCLRNIEKQWGKSILHSEMPELIEKKPDPSSFGSCLDWAGQSKPGQGSCAVRGRRKKGQLNHKPNSLGGQMDSKSKHTRVKRCCETLTEALGIKCAHQLYSIYRPVWLCLSEPWLSPDGWSLSASNTEVQS